MHRILAIILMFSGLGYYTQAQIVNVEGKRGKVTQDGWHGSIDLNGNITQNTARVVDYGIRSNVQYLKNRHRILVLADLDRVRAGEEDFVDRGYSHLRYNLEFGKERRFAFEAFGQAQYNSVQLIQYRQLAGAGVRFSLSQTDSLKCWFGTLPMYEYEELTTGIIERNIRQSSYLFFFYTLERFEIQTINYYQPNVTDFADFRLSTGTTLEFGVLKWLRFVTSLNLTYDSRPPEEVPNLVYILKNGIKLEF